MKRRSYRLCQGAGALLLGFAAAAGEQAVQAQTGSAPVTPGTSQPPFQYTQPRYAGPQPYPQPMRGNGRKISDQDHAQDMRKRREVLPLGDLLETAQRQGKGEFLGVEPDVSSNLYRFKFMRADGKVVWVDVNARSGQVLAVK